MSYTRWRVVDSVMCRDYVAEGRTAVRTDRMERDAGRRAPVAQHDRGHMARARPAADPPRFGRRRRARVDNARLLRRKPAANFELILSPDRLRIACSLSGYATVEMARDSAGWLVANREIAG